MNEYLVLSISFGEPTMEMVSKKELSSRLEKDEHGDNYYGNPLILEEIPSESEWIQQQENSLIIFKGSLIVPKPVQVVTKYEF